MSDPEYPHSTNETRTDRRAFFEGVLGRARGAAAQLKKPVKIPESISLGHMREFPVGGEYLITVFYGDNADNKMNILIQSLAEGFRACLTNKTDIDPTLNQWMQLRLQSNGEIIAEVKNTISKEYVLSILTGEMSHI